MKIPPGLLMSAPDDPRGFWWLSDCPENVWLKLMLQVFPALPAEPVDKITDDRL